MRISLFIFFVLYAFQFLGQTKLSFGPMYSIGYSTIIAPKSTGADEMIMDNSMKVKPGAGVGLRSEFDLNKNWAIFFQAGYQQRGAIFENYMDAYKPRYRLNYIDFVLGPQYRFFQSEKLRLTVNTGVTQNTLISAERVYDTGSDNITTEFNQAQFGIYTGAGVDLPVFKKDYLQFISFLSYNLSDVYSRGMNINQQSGKNILFGIQISYLIRAVKTEE